MDIKKYLLLLILLIYSINIAWTQSPTHFKIGESTFANVDIYSILQTTDSKLFVATNDGVFIKGYNSFKRVPPIKSQKGNSFFNLTTNNKGEVFCHNLKGQIFKISEGQLKLYYEVSLDEQVSSTEFFFDENDDLLVFAKNFFKLNSKFEKKIIFKNNLKMYPTRTVFIRPMQMVDGTIISSYIDKKEEINKFIIYKNNELGICNYTDVKWIEKKKNFEGSISGFIFNDTVTYVTENRQFSDIYQINTNSYDWRVINQISDSTLLSLNHKKGINFWNFKNKIITQNIVLFPNTFISSYHLNEDGSLLLGTFGEGIIVVPNFNSLEVKVDNSLRGIDVNRDKAIIGSREGILYEYSNELKVIDERKYNLDEIFVLKKDYSFLPESDIVTSYGSFITMPIIKEVAEADSGFFFASSSGISYASDNIKNEEINSYTKLEVHKNVVVIYDDSRISSLIYDGILKELYFSDLNEVKYLSNKNIVKELKYEGESIFCNDLECYNKKLMLATPERGVLFFTNHSFNFALNKENGLLSNNIKKLKLVGDWLYILTKKGLQVFDIKQNQLASISIENGIIDNLISDFSANQNNLWLLKSKSFIKIPTNTILFNKQELSFSIDSLSANNKKISFKELLKLNSKQNKFSVFLNFYDIIKIRNAEFQIKVDGQEWDSYPASQNKIEIKNFGYGSHNLQIRLKYGNDFSDNQNLEFNRSSPLYLRWWFYPLIILIFVGLIILFFRRKLKYQAKESRRENELNASKLKTIQSQMNPHFIFNALNSIQYLVIKKDTDSAYNYITRFANLIRKTLDFSEKKTISILQEIELLEVYLELEKLRFQDDFEYKIEKKNIRDVQIPPMLIQPFIENALVHGLLHKKGVKKLTIRIEAFEDYLQCIIEDNGIGRQEANKIRKRQKGEHESFALNAINNRFRILNENSDQKLGYEYQDSTPSEGGISTRVIVTIPIK